MTAAPLLAALALGVGAQAPVEVGRPPLTEPELKALVRALGDDDPDVRDRAARELAAGYGPELAARLAAVRTEDAEVRARLDELLRVSGPAELLRRRLSPACLAAQKGLAYDLFAGDGRGFLERVLRPLDGIAPLPNVRPPLEGCAEEDLAALLGALGEARPSPARDLASVWLVQGAGHERGLPRVAAMLRDRPDALRAEALQCLAVFEEKAAAHADAVEALFDDEELRFEARRTLIRIRPDAATARRFAALLRGKDANARWDALERLAELGPAGRGEVEEIRRVASGDKWDSVRGRARLTLYRLGQLPEEVYEAEELEQYDVPVFFVEHPKDDP